MDFVRGCSALLVCCGHLRAVMFIDFNTLSFPSVIHRAFYFLTSLGHEAVMVFFVLSGFFVGGSVLSKKLKFRFHDYLIARLSRLWTVLIPALVLTFILDRVIGHFYPSILEGAYHFELMSGPDQSFSDSILTFFANIAFLQNIYSPVYGTNGPLWSLTNEFWYYITFPLIMIAVSVVKLSRSQRIISILALLIVFYFFTSHVFGGFLIWLAGVLVFIVYQRKSMNLGLWFTALSFVVFALSLVNSKAAFIQSYIQIPPDFVVGITFSFFLISLRNVENSQWIQKYLSKIAFWLSDISYTLYVTHFPIFILVYSIFYKDRQVELNAFTFLQYLGWIFGAIIISRIIWWIFERNTPYVRTFMFSVRNKITNKFSVER